MNNKGSAALVAILVALGMILAGVGIWYVSNRAPSSITLPEGSFGVKYSVALSVEGLTESNAETAMDSSKLPPGISVKFIQSPCAPQATQCPSHPYLIGVPTDFGSYNFVVKTQSAQINYSLLISSSTNLINKADNETSSQTNETLPETFKNQPGRIVNYVLNNSGWILSVDLLTQNPKWTPGGDELFFLNQNLKVRDLSVTSSTKAYECGNNNVVFGPVITSTPEILISKIESKSDKNSRTAYFDIVDSLITAIYEQCLP